MNKIRTLTQLQDFLDREYSWRLREIAELKSLVKTVSQIECSTIIRAGVPLLYAHWEGFVKNSSLAYLNFVNCQGLKYSELSACFIVFGLKKKLDDLSGSKRSRLNIEAMEFLLSQLSERATLKMSNAIDTESNLKSSVFENIALSIGIDPSPFETKYNFIDESLLKRRNSIAHGEYLDLKSDDYRKLADETLGLIRKYKTDIQNAASLGAYRS